MTQRRLDSKAQNKASKNKVQAIFIKFYVRIKKQEGPNLHKEIFYVKSDQMHKVCKIKIKQQRVPMFQLKVK